MPTSNSPTTSRTSKPTIISIRKQENNFQRAEVIKRNREKRTQHAQFLVEGVAQINIAVKHGWRVYAFIYADDRALSSWAEALLDSNIAEQHWELSADLLAALSDKDEPSELLAIIETRTLTPSAIPPKQDGLVVVFDRPSSPGNLGSSIRSAHAFGADGIIITGHAVDIYDPFVVRGSMGAIFGMPVSTAPSHTDVQAWVAAARAAGFNYKVVGSSSRSEEQLSQCALSGPTLLVLGNETVGMSRGYKEMCDTTVTIPIVGELSSINVSCAASILLYEVSRQRAADNRGAN